MVPLPVGPSEQRREEQLGRALRNYARPAGGDPYGHRLVGALTPGAPGENGGNPSYEPFRLRGDGTATQQHPVDVEQPHEVRGAGAEHPGRLVQVAASHRAETQRLDAATVAATAGRTVQLDDLMPELAGAGPGPRCSAPPITRPAPRPVPRCR